MKFILKGITNSNSILATDSIGMSQYTFDLRPKSFNFVQSRKIVEMISGDTKSRVYSLLFENEKDFVIKQLLTQINPSIGEEQNLFLEFAGITPLVECEKYEHDYIWHYHDGEKIKNITDTKYLKRIVFRHSDLEYLSSNGELHGFFNLFSEYFDRIFIEVQLNWDSPIMFSIFEFFKIPLLSFEITDQVEIGYQNPDHDLIISHITNVKNMFDEQKENI